MSSVYLLTDARASVHADHPDGQGLGELLTLLGDLQGQLSGGSHDHRWGGDIDKTITTHTGGLEWT